MSSDPTDDVYGDRWIRYGARTRTKDRKATAFDMRCAARGYRLAATGDVDSTLSTEINLAHAAYCESLAERKEREPVE